MSGPLWEYLDIFVVYKPGVNVYYKYLYVKTLNVLNVIIWKSWEWYNMKMLLWWYADYLQSVCSVKDTNEMNSHLNQSGYANLNTRKLNLRWNE